MAKEPVCPHRTVRTGNAVGSWECEVCGTAFVPEWTVDALVVARAQVTLDTIASTMSAVLWDFHTRAMAQHGVGIEGIETPDTAMFEYTPETCPTHEWDAGQCIHCGSSQFLGDVK